MKTQETLAKLLALGMIFLLLVSGLPLPDSEIATTSSAESPQSKDSDGDGLSDEQEIENRTNPDMTDTDEDGISDYDELTSWHTNPTRESTDGDRYDDGMEIFGHSPVGLGELGGDMPGYVKGAGKSPFVAAYPEVDFEISDRIEIETLEEITYSDVTIASETYGYSTSVTRGTSISMGNTEGYSKNSWIDVSNEKQDIEQKKSYIDTVTNTEEKFWNGWSQGTTIETEKGWNAGVKVSFPPSISAGVDYHANEKTIIETGTYGDAYKGASVMVSKGGEETSTRILKSSASHGSGEESSFSTTVTKTSYTETSVTNSREMTQGREWGEATTTDTNKAAELRFFFYIKNVGTDIAREVKDLRFNIFIGEDIFPINYPALTDQEGNTNPGLSFSNLLPGQKKGQFTGEVYLSLEQVKAIDDKGKNIRIRIVDYTFGEDQIFFEDAWGKCVLFEIDDGVADGDESIDKYMIATWGNETYVNVMQKYFNVELYEGVISSIEGYDVTENSWWNIYTQGSSGKNHFSEEISEEHSRVLMVYYQDSDYDFYPDRVEMKTGTSLDLKADHPSPILIAGYCPEEKGNNTVVKFKLENVGDFDAYGIEVIGYSKDNDTIINDSLIGGGGRLSSNAKIVIENDSIETSNLSNTVLQVNYNDLKGHHSFITQLEISSLNNDISENASDMIYEPKLIVSPLDETWFHNASYPIFFSFDNPLEESIENATFHVSYQRLDGSLIHNESFAMTLNSGMNWFTTNFSVSEYHEVNTEGEQMKIVVFLVDGADNIMTYDIQRIDVVCVGKRPKITISRQSWSVGILPEGYQPYTVLNEGVAPLNYRLVFQDSTRAFNLKMLSANLTEVVSVEPGFSISFALNFSSGDIATVYSNDPDLTKTYLNLASENTTVWSKITENFSDGTTHKKLDYSTKGSKTVFVELPTDAIVTRSELNVSIDAKNYTNEFSSRDNFSKSGGKSETVDLNYTTANHKTDHYEIFRLYKDAFFVDIYATNISTSAFQINGCNSWEYALGKWRIYCQEYDYESNRALVYKTLFYGTNGNDPRVSETYIKDLSAIKTLHSDDIGKRAHYVSCSDKPIGQFSHVYTGSFNERFDNKRASVWSNLYTSKDSVDAEFNFANLIVNKVQSGGSSDEIGTNTSGEEKDNPAKAYFNFRGNTPDTQTANGKAIIICNGEITWENDGMESVSAMDFYKDKGIPLFSRLDTYSKEMIVQLKEKTFPEQIEYLSVSASRKTPSDTILTFEVSHDGRHWQSMGTEFNKLLRYEGQSKYLFLRFILKTTTSYDTPEIYNYAVKLWTKNLLEIDIGDDDSPEWHFTLYNDSATLFGTEFDEGLKEVQDIGRVVLKSSALNSKLNQDSKKNSKIPLSFKVSEPGTVNLTNLYIEYYRRDELPDLTIVSSSVEASGTTIIEGDIAEVNVTIKNVGYRNVSNFVASFYTDEFSEMSCIGHYPVTSTLGVNETRNVSISWNTSGCSGDYKIFVVVDKADRIIEFNETNNSVFAVVDILSKPDLVPLKISTIPNHMIDKKTGKIRCKIENRGSETGKLNVSFYEGNPWDGGTLIEIVKIGFLGTFNYTNVTANWSKESGNYRIYVLVDSSGEVVESNESNNIVSQVIYVHTKPDIVPTKVQHTDIISGITKKIDFTVTLENRGETTATKFSTNFLVDGALYDRLENISLNPGEAQISFHWIPKNGNHEVRFVIDSADTVDEFNETNNNITYSLGVETPSPIIELFSPIGGETLMREEWCIVTWEAAGNLAKNPINLYYSIDGGTSWTIIKPANMINTGHFNWTVPNTETQTGLIKVTALDIYGNNVSDVSDTTFAIDPPPTSQETGNKVFTPSPGGRLRSGSEVRLEWRLKGEQQVSLYYSTDFGQTWNIVVEDIQNVGVCNWMIPDDFTSESVLLKVCGDDAEVTSGLFTIEEESKPKGETSEQSDSYGTITLGLLGLLVMVLVVLGGVVKYKPIKKNRGGKNG